MNMNRFILGSTAAFLAFVYAAHASGGQDPNATSEQASVGSYEKEKFNALLKIKAPLSVAKSPAGDAYYIANSDKDTVTIVDAKDFTQKEIRVGKRPMGVAVDGKGYRAYVTNMKEGSVSVIDLAESAVIETIETGHNPYCLVFGREEKHLYVVNRFGDRVFVIDTVSNQVTGTTPIYQLDMGVRVNSCYKSCHDGAKRTLLSHVPSSK